MGSCEILFKHLGLESHSIGDLRCTVTQMKAFASYLL